MTSQLHRQTCSQLVQPEDASDLMQYVAGGGATVHLEIDGSDLVPAEGHVIINGNQVTMEQLTGTICC